MCLAICPSAPHSQAAVEAITCLCVFEWNRRIPVQRRSKLIHANRKKLILGGVGLTTLINVLSLEMFSRYSMLHLYSAHCAILVPDWAGSFKSSIAAGTNGCLDLSCHSYPSTSITRQEPLYRRCSGF